MQITGFTPDDIHPFLAMARDEGWISTRRELSFLLDQAAHGCLVWREEGIPQGFVTTVRHGRSAWIGNLLVRNDVRGRGIGSGLFQRAMNVLARDGVATVWLTASRAGRPLYERRGFISCDRICRWERSGCAEQLLPAAAVLQKGWQEIDCRGWGDTRDKLLAYVASGGTVLGDEHGFLMMQGVGNGVQIGPFGASDSAIAGKLLHRALATLSGRLLLDVPSANFEASRILSANGFSIIGETELMYAGLLPAYHPQLVYGLASLGSMG